MKRLLLLSPLLLSLLLASCSTKKKYNSFREAVDACKEWADKGEFYIVKSTEKTVSTYVGKNRYSETFPSLKYEVPLRSCEEEMQTKQVLGLEIINRKAKAIYNSLSYTSRTFPSYGRGLIDDKTEVKKNFYF